MTIDRSINTSQVSPPPEYEPASSSELIQKLKYVRDTAIDRLITVLQRDGKLAGTAALSELGFTSEAMATALNGCFVPRDERATTVLNEGDQLEILAPMQGG